MTTRKPLGTLSPQDASARHTPAKSERLHPLTRGRAFTLAGSLPAALPAPDLVPSTSTTASSAKKQTRATAQSGESEQQASRSRSSSFGHFLSTHFRRKLPVPPNSKKDDTDKKKKQQHEKHHEQQRQQQQETQPVPATPKQREQEKKEAKQSGEGAKTPVVKMRPKNRNPAAVRPASMTSAGGARPAAFSARPVTFVASRLNATLPESDVASPTIVIHPPSEEATRAAQRRSIYMAEEAELNLESLLRDLQNDTTHSAHNSEDAISQGQQGSSLAPLQSVSPQTGTRIADAELTNFPASPDSWVAELADMVESPAAALQFSPSAVNQLLATPKREAATLHTPVRSRARSPPKPSEGSKNPQSPADSAADSALRTPLDKAKQVRQSGSMDDLLSPFKFASMAADESDDGAASADGGADGSCEEEDEGKRECKRPIAPAVALLGEAIPEEPEVKVVMRKKKSAQANIYVDDEEASPDFRTLALYATPLNANSRKSRCWTGDIELPKILLNGEIEEEEEEEEEDEAGDTGRKKRASPMSRGRTVSFASPSARKQPSPLGKGYVGSPLQRSFIIAPAKTPGGDESNVSMAASEIDSPLRELLQLVTSPNPDASSSPFQHPARMNHESVGPASLPPPQTLAPQPPLETQATSRQETGEGGEENDAQGNAGKEPCKENTESAPPALDSPSTPRFEVGSAVVAIADLVEIEGEGAPPDSAHELLPLREGRVYKVIGCSESNPRFLVAQSQDQVGYIFEDNVCALHDWLNSSPSSRKPHAPKRVSLPNTESERPREEDLPLSRTTVFRPRPASVVLSNYRAESTSSEEDTSDEEEMIRELQARLEEAERLNESESQEEEEAESPNTSTQACEGQNAYALRNGVDADLEATCILGSVKHSLSQRRRSRSSALGGVSFLLPQEELTTSQELGLTLKEPMTAPLVPLTDTNSSVDSTLHASSETSAAAPVLLRAGKGIAATAVSRLQQRPRPMTEMPSTVTFKRYNALMELVTTEESYVRDLNILQNIFAMPLSPTGQMSHLLPPKDHQAIFSYIGELIASNTKFLRQLQVFVNGYESPKNQEPRFRARLPSRTHHPDVLSPVSTSTVPVMSPHVIPNVSIATAKSVARLSTLGEVIQANLTLFRSHETYSCHHKRGRQVLTAARRENVLLDTWLKACERGRPECRSLDLEAFLHAPVQRITRYPLLLKEILKSTDKEDSEWVALNDAVRLVEQYVQHINEETRIVESDTRTSELLEVLHWQSGKDFRKWFATPQEVRTEGNLRIRLQANKRRKWVSAHAYLYTEVLLIVKAEGKSHSSSSWKYVLDPIPLSELLVVCDPSPKHSGRTSTVFELEHIETGLQVRVDADSHDNKLFWVRSLQEQCSDKGRWRRRRGAVASVDLVQTQPTHYLTKTPAARKRRNPVLTPSAAVKVRFGSSTYMDEQGNVHDGAPSDDSQLHGGGYDPQGDGSLIYADEHPSFEQPAGMIAPTSPTERQRGGDKKQRRGGLLARRIRPVSMPPLAPSTGAMRDLDELISQQEREPEALEAALRSRHSVRAIAEEMSLRHLRGQAQTEEANARGRCMSMDSKHTQPSSNSSAAARMGQTQRITVLLGPHETDGRRNTVSGGAPPSRRYDRIPTPDGKRVLAEDVI